MSESFFEILPARKAEDLDVIRALFREYEAAIEIDLCFQGFEEELATLPGRYSPPTGELLIARNREGEPIGCVAVRPLKNDICEMKRLFVAPSGRGLGVGRALVNAILAEAARMGYKQMWLDTLPTMADAIRLYEKSGFAPIDPYNEAPIEVVYMGKRLP